MRSTHIIMLTCLYLLYAPASAIAHCDSLNGPVISDARIALEKADSTPVLKWVKQENEDEVKAAFTQALEARKSGNKAKELADQRFFETLVRIHRQGEGQSFTGLKPGEDVEAGILAADQALESGTASDLAHELSNALQQQLEIRLKRVIDLKKHASDSVDAGRKFVAAYVGYIHFVERIHTLISQDPSHGHSEDPHAVHRE